PIRYAVVGLGSGALANYARAGDVVRVYEINPLVEKLARTLFVALPTCEGKVEVVLGDARLSLEREAPQAYDLIAVDAFSSDSIPVHLLTREAFAQYRRHLAPGGVVAVHISNRYLDLEPVLLAEAREGGWQVREVTNDAVPEGGAFSSDWVLMVRDGELLLHATLSKVALPLDGKRSIPPWTDDFSNLYTILR
ncbi:MAG: fused MFS/spermidine synthase, partial [Acidobacteria bacterium]|nr:fused MFS/spermidine synthase [Acidobacteriota bacterium]